MDLNDDMLNLILSKTDNYYCIGVCKQWYDIIIKNSIICETCNKIVKMYDTVLWITDDNDIVCHGYYGDIKKYKTLKKIIFRDPRFLTKIKRVSIGLWLIAIKISSFPYDLIKNINEKWYTHALKYNPKYLQYIKNPTYSMCVDIVNNCFDGLQYVPENFKSYELCLTAVKKNGSVLKYVPDQFQSKEMGLVAVRDNISYLRYINNPSEELIIEILSDDKVHMFRNFNWPEYIKNPTEDIYIALYNREPVYLDLIGYEQ